MSPQPKRPIKPRPAVVAQSAQATSGQATIPYSIQKAAGGSYHTYAGGRRVFVPARIGATGAAKPAGKPGWSAPPAAPVPPTQSAASVQAAGAAVAPTDARDGQYYADSALDAKARADGLTRYTSEDDTDNTNYREALRRFREQQPRQLRNNLIEMQRRGLAQSSTRDEEDADIGIQNTRQEADMSGARGDRKAARETAMRALRDGATLEDAARLAQAADRKVNYYSERAADNSLALNQGAQSPEQSTAPTVQGVSVPRKPADDPDFARRWSAGLKQQVARQVASGTRADARTSSAVAVNAARRRAAAARRKIR